MKRLLLALFAFMFALAFLPFRASSQFISSCPSVIEHALQRVERICAATGRNQICYANSWTQAEPQAFITDFSFEPGDITELTNIRRLRLGGLDPVTDQWGMVLMRLQANVPATLPGQNVLFLLFGDVDLEDQYGGIDSPVSNPMQAVRLRTAVGSPDCSQAPPNGLLVQTPHGVGRVLLQVNGVDISLGSTVFLTAQPNQDLTISTLEGSALVYANGGWSAALPGTQVRVPMTANLEPAGPPLLPEPYTMNAIVTLPVASLERPVTLLEPLPALPLRELQQSILAGGVPNIAEFSQLSLDLTQSSVQYLTTTAANAVSLTSNTLTTTTNRVTAVTSSTIDGAQALVNDLVPEAIGQPVAAVVDTAQTVVTDTTQVVANTIDTAANLVNDVADTAANTANDTVAQVADTAGDIVATTQNTVQNTVNAVQTAIPLPLPLPTLPPLPPLLGR